MALSFSKRTLLAFVACFLMRAISGGTVYCSGILYNNFLNEFGRSSFETSFVFSLVYSLVPGAGFIVGILLKHIQPRCVIFVGSVIASASLLGAAFASNYYQLLICFGIIHGTAQGLVFITIPVTATFLVDRKYHHIAMAVLGGGDGTGFTLFPLIYDSLLAAYGWRQALIFVAGFTLNICVCAMLIPKNVQVHHSDESADHKTHGKSKRRFLCSAKLFKMLKFYCLVLAPLTDLMGYCIFTSFIYAHLVSEGLSVGTVARMVMTMGASGFLARCSTSLLDNRPYFRRYAIHAASFLSLGICVFALATFTMSVPAYFSVMALFGWFCGWDGSLVCCVAMDVMGPKHLTDTFTAQMCVHGIGYFIGAPLGGLINDATGSYAVALTVGAALMACSCLFLMPLYFTKKHYEKWAEESIEAIEEEVEEYELVFSDTVRGSILQLYGGSMLHLNHE